VGRSSRAARASWQPLLYCRTSTSAAMYCHLGDRIEHARIPVRQPRPWPSEGGAGLTLQYEAATARKRRSHEHEGRTSPGVLPRARGFGVAAAEPVVKFHDAAVWR
jgi:hypothetical protein